MLRRRPHSSGMGDFGPRLGNAGPLEASFDAIRWSTRGIFFIFSDACARDCLAPVFFATAKRSLEWASESAARNRNRAATAKKSARSPRPRRQLRPRTSVNSNIDRVRAHGPAASSIPFAVVPPKGLKTKAGRRKSSKFHETQVTERIIATCSDELANTYALSVRWRAPA